LRIEHEHLTLDAGWGGAAQVKQIAPQLSEFVREQLGPVVRSAPLQGPTGPAQCPDPSAGGSGENPTGLGALTVSLLDGEVCDWQRSKHRKAVGQYTGCCPSEHSSGGMQRFGHIDRHGNKHLRTWLVEAVWRLLKWQPGWHARQKFLQKLLHGASLKKKMAVALAANWPLIVALAHRPGHGRRTGLELARCPAEKRAE